MENKHLDYLDLLKGIAVFMVVSLHLPLYMISLNDISGTWNLILYFLRLISEGVPIFLIVNGFLLFKKQEIDIKKHYLKVLKLIFLYFFWVALYLIILERPETLLKYFDIKGFLVEILGQDNYSDYTAQFWFVLSLIRIYLIYPIIWSCYKNNYKLFVVFVFIIGLFTIGLDTIDLIRELLESLNCNVWLLDNMIWFISRNVTISYDLLWPLFYFLLGGILYQNRERVLDNRTKYLAIGIVGLVLLFTYAYVISAIKKSLYDLAFSFGSMAMVMIVIGLFSLSIKYENKGRLTDKLICGIGRNSFGIYLFNVLVISFVNRFTSISRIFAYLISIAVCYAVSLIIGKIKITKFFISL